MKTLQLPQEVWDMIIERVDEKTQKQLRLVCTAFEPHATKCTFAELSVCLQERSLRRLVTVSQNLRLAPHVRVLSIGGESVRISHDSVRNFLAGLVEHWAADGHEEYKTGEMQDYISNEDFEAVTIERFNDFDWEFENYGEYLTFDTLTRKDFPDIEWPSLLLENGCDPQEAFSLYKESGKMRLAHLDFVRHDSDVKLLATAFSNFANLTTVRLERGSESWGAVTPGETELWVDRQDPQDRLTSCFLRGLVTAGSPLRLLKFSMTERQSWNASEGFLENRRLGVEDFRVAAPFLCHITHFAYKVITPYKADEPFLPHLLQSLVYLTLLDWKNLRICRDFSMDRILEAIISTRLHTVSFTDCVFNLRPLTKFLMLHKDTLKRIDLLHVDVVELSKETLQTLLREQLFYKPQDVEKCIRGLKALRYRLPSDVELERHIRRYSPGGPLTPPLFITHSWTHDSVASTVTGKFISDGTASSWEIFRTPPIDYAVNVLCDQANS